MEKVFSLIDNLLTSDISEDEMYWSLLEVLEEVDKPVEVLVKQTLNHVEEFMKVSKLPLGFVFVGNTGFEETLNTYAFTRGITGADKISNYLLVSVGSLLVVHESKILASLAYVLARVIYCTKLNSQQEMPVTMHVPMFHATMKRNDESEYYKELLLIRAYASTDLKQFLANLKKYSIATSPVEEYVPNTCTQLGGLPYELDKFSFSKDLTPSDKLVDLCSSNKGNLQKVIEHLLNFRDYYSWFDMYSDFSVSDKSLIHALYRNVISLVNSEGELGEYSSFTELNLFDLLNSGDMWEPALKVVTHVIRGKNLTKGNLSKEPTPLEVYAMSRCTEGGEQVLNQRLDTSEQLLTLMTLAHSVGYSSMSEMPASYMDKKFYGDLLLDGDEQQQQASLSYQELRGQVANLFNSEEGSTLKVTYSENGYQFDQSTPMDTYSDKSDLMTELVLNLTRVKLFKKLKLSKGKNDFVQVSIRRYNTWLPIVTLRETLIILTKDNEIKEFEPTLTKEVEEALQNVRDLVSNTLLNIYNHVTNTDYDLVQLNYRTNYLKCPEKISKVVLESLQLKMLISTDTKEELVEQLLTNVGKYVLGAKKRRLFLASPHNENRNLAIQIVNGCIPEGKVLTANLNDVLEEVDKLID